MKKNLYTLMIMAVFALVAMPMLAQEMDKTLNITVTSDTKENLKGQEVTVTQTDYSLNYASVVLDAEGKATVKAFAGNHSVKVERAGYNTATTTFTIAESETSKSVTLNLTEKTRTPFALEANLIVDPYTAAKKLALTWNTEKPAFYDNFESYDAFAVEFGDWTGIDGDKLNAAPLVGDYPNRGLRQYAQIMNPLAVTPIWYYDYPVLRAYEGKQYVGFVRTSTGDANNDWLISPEITVGTDNILSFMAKAADVYPEKFIVYITTQTNNPDKNDFVQLSPGNYETVDYKGWHEKNYDLSAYAGQKVKIAIRYVGEANSGGAFMLMVDDFYVGQPFYEGQPTAAPRHSLQGKAQRVPVVSDMQRSPANPNEVFDVYLDNNLMGSTGNYSYTIENIADGTHTYGVKARYKVAETELVSGTITVDNSAYSNIKFNVSADSKATVDGQQINILSTATGENYILTVAGGKAEIKALPNGEYTITIQKGAFKEYSVKETITGDKTFTVALEDDVQTPYNITAELTNGTEGKMDALLRWNQILGFKDSFEEYEDFATGDFGGWKTIDNDKMPVYPIALGSQTNIVSFPGSGTANQPTAIPPMVFNPWKTTPAMLPTDPAMYAPDGDKYVVFFSPQRSTADKWLISPLVDIHEGYEFKVTAKSYTSSLPESIEFAVSENGGDHPEDFTVISSAKNMPSEMWSEFSTPLAAYEGKQVRLAVHYNTYDGFFAQVDNIKVEPENGGGTVMNYGNVVKFNIYLDNTKVGETDKSEYSLTGLTEGTHTIGIEAVYKNATSEMATYQLVVSSIGEVTISTMPAKAEVFTLSGQKMDCSVDALPQGVYVVKSGNKVMKVRK